MTIEDVQPAIGATRGDVFRHSSVAAAGLAQRGQGLGRTLAAVSMLAVPRGERVFVQVAPGNAASLRAVLAAGFHPIGAEVLFLKDGGAPH